MNIEISETNSVWLNTAAKRLNLPTGKLLEIILQMLRQRDELPEAGKEGSSIEDWIQSAGNAHTMDSELRSELRNAANAAAEAINATRHYINLIERHRK